jgi:hypothetical protein
MPPLFPDDDELESRSLHDPDAVEPEVERNERIRQECVDNIALVLTTERAQRDREHDDLVFDAISQWSDAARQERRGHADEDGNIVPERPALEINLIDQSLQQISGEARAARLALKVLPKGQSGVDVAERLQGLIRAIQSDSGATEARMWALERALRCGRGYYLIDTDYANDLDADLDVVYRRILDQSGVFFDPYASRADLSDAAWAAVATWMSEDEHRRHWPTAERPAYGSDEWLAMSSWSVPWVRGDSDDHQPAFRVSQYYKVQVTADVIAYHPQKGAVNLSAAARAAGESGEIDPELREALTRENGYVRIREVERRSITKYWVDGTQMLEAAPWDGRWIPVVPVFGKEYNVDGERIWKGVVSNAKDAQRSFNVMRSAQTEAAALVPRVSYIGAEGQDEGYEEMWQNANRVAYAFLPYKPVSYEGHLAPPPHREQAEPPIQHLALLTHEAREDLKGATMRYDPSLGKMSAEQQSGKAIEALQQQGVAATSNYLDNMAQISMPLEGRILIDLVPRVYDAAGRIVTVRSEESDDEEAVMLRRPFTRDKNGAPQPVPCPMCQGRKEIAPLAPGGSTECPACRGEGVAVRPEQAPEAEYVDLADGEMKVVVSVGRAAQTRRQEAITAMAELSQSLPPEMVMAYAHIWVRNMDFPGAQEIADILKGMNPHAQKDGEADIPPEAQQALQQMQQVLEETQSALQEAEQRIATDQVKAQQQAQTKQMEMQGKMALQQMQVQADAQLAMLEGQQKERIERMKAHVSMLKEAAAAKGDAAEAEVDARTQEMLQEMEQAHELALERFRRESEQQLEAMRQAGALRAEALKGALSMAAAEAAPAERQQTGATESRN